MSRRFRYALAAGIPLLSACGGTGPSEDEALKVRIIEVSPEGRVESTQPIQVRFDKPVVDPERVGEVLGGELFVVSPVVEGTYRFVDVDRLELRPDAPFASSTRYRVTVRPEAVGLGRTLAGHRGFRFHTSLFALLGTTWQERGARARAALRFSHPVDPAEVERASLFETGEGVFVPAVAVTRRPGRRVVLRLPMSLSEAREKDVRIRIDGALKALTGGEPLSKTVVRGIPSPEFAPELRILGLKGLQVGLNPAIEVLTTEPVEPDVFEAALGLEPSARQLELLDSGRGLLLMGDLQAGGTYRVRVSPTGGGRDGGELIDPFVGEVTLPELGPGIEFVDRSRYLSVSDAGRLRFRARGIETVRMALRPVPEVNAVHVLDALERGVPLASTSLLGPSDEVEVPVEGTGESTAYLPASSGPVLVQVSLQDASRPWIRTDRWVTSRGLKLVVKVSDGRLFAHVLDVERREPASGVRISARSRTSQVVAQATTGSDGTALLTMAEGRPIVVSARRGDRYAFVSLRSAPLVRGPSRSSSEMSSILVDPIEARPGDPVRLAAYLPAAGDSVAFRLVDGGAIIDEVEATSEVTHWYEGTLLLPPRVDRRRWTVDVVDGGQPRGSAKVRVRPAFHEGLELSVRATGRQDERAEFEVGAGDDTDIEVRCVYEPRALRDASGLSVRSRFQPFRGPKRKVEPGAVTCPIPESVRGPAWVRLRAEGTDALGRRKQAQAELAVASSRTFLALNVRPGDAPEVRVGILDDQGRPVAGQLVQFELSRVLVEEAAVFEPKLGIVAEGRRRELPAQQGRQTTGQAGVALPLDVEDPGRYRLAVRWSDQQDEVSFTSGDPDPRLQLRVGPERPLAGSKLRVTVRSPEPGWAFVSLEGDEVYDGRWVELKHSEEIETELNIPSDVPEAARVVVLHRGRAAVRPVQFGALGGRRKLKVEPFGVDQGLLRYVVRIEPPPAAASSVLIAVEGSLPSRRAAAAPLASYGGPPLSSVRVEAGRESAAPGTATWQALMVGSDGFGIVRCPEPIEPGEHVVWVSSDERLSTRVAEVAVHPDAAVELAGPSRLAVGDRVPLQVRSTADPGSLRWVGVSPDEQPMVAPKTPGTLVVTAAAGAAQSSLRWEVGGEPRSDLTAQRLNAGYERPGTVEVAGSQAWVWLGARPAWLAIADVVAWETRPDDEAVAAARLLMSKLLGPGATRVFAQAVGGDGVDDDRNLEILRRSLLTGRLAGLDPWTRLAALVALRETGDRTDQAAAEARLRRLPDPVKAVAEALVESAVSGSTSDPLAAMLVRALVEPTAVDVDAWSRRSSDTPAARALQVWGLERAHWFQGPRPYWGTLTLDEEVVRRFNSERSLAESIEARGMLRAETTGSGRVYGSVLAAKETAESPFEATLRHLDGRPAASLAVDQVVWLSLSVQAEGHWSAAVDLPGGLAVEGVTGWAPPNDASGPPRVDPQAVEVDPVAGRVRIALYEGPGRLRLAVRGEWPGRYAGPWVRFAAAEQAGTGVARSLGPIVVTAPQASPR